MGLLGLRMEMIIVICKSNLLDDADADDDVEERIRREADGNIL